MHAAGIKTVISYCGTLPLYLTIISTCVPRIMLTRKGTVGQSKGRGPRVSSWLQDIIDDKGDRTTRSLTLEGGIKGWAKAGDKYTDRMVAYDAEFWEGSD